MPRRSVASGRCDPATGRLFRREQIDGTLAKGPLPQTLAAMKTLPLLAGAALIVALFVGLANRAKAAPLKVGDEAPTVTGVTDQGTDLNLGDVYKKQPYTLVYFFPKADTPGCTKQGCSLRDAYQKLQDKGVAVIGVSHDKVAAQKAFKEKYNFPFTLIADHDKKVTDAFGVPDIMMTGLATRQAYLVKDGKIVWCDYKASTTKQADDVLKVLASQGS